MFTSARGAELVIQIRVSWLAPRRRGPDQEARPFQLSFQHQRLGGANAGVLPGFPRPGDVPRLRLLLGRQPPLLDELDQRPVLHHEVSQAGGAQCAGRTWVIAMDAVIGLRTQGLPARQCGPGARPGPQRAFRSGGRSPPAAPSVPGSCRTRPSGSRSATCSQLPRLRRSGRTRPPSRHRGR